MARLFGAEARASIAVAIPPELPDEEALLAAIQVRVGKYADHEKLRHHLRTTRGQLHWAVNCYFREVCISPDPSTGRMDFEPLSLRHVATIAMERVAAGTPSGSQPDAPRVPPGVAGHQRAGAAGLGGGERQSTASAACSVPSACARDTRQPTQAALHSGDNGETPLVVVTEDQAGTHPGRAATEVCSLPHCSHPCSLPGSAPTWGIASLPAPLLERILSMCTPTSVANTAMTCRTMAQAARSDTVWKPLYLSYWSTAPANSVLASPIWSTSAEDGHAVGMRELFQKRLRFEMDMKCLKCGQQKVVPLVFGFPSVPLVQHMRLNQLVLGGDYLADGEARAEPCWICCACGIRYTRFPYSPGPVAPGADGPQACGGHAAAGPSGR